jgi:hypothetical protein
MEEPEKFYYKELTLEDLKNTLLDLSEKAKVRPERRFVIGGYCKTVGHAITVDMIGPGWPFCGDKECSFCNGFNKAMEYAAEKYIDKDE